MLLLLFFLMQLTLVDLCVCVCVSDSHRTLQALETNRYPKLAHQEAQPTS